MDPTRLTVDVCRLCGAVVATTLFERHVRVHSLFASPRKNSAGRYEIAVTPRDPPS